PATQQKGKVKKKTADLRLELEPTPDTLAWLGQNRRPNQQLIGFAMETESLIPAAIEKRTRKNADYIIANTISQTPGTKARSGFESDQNEVYIIGPQTRAEAPPEPVSGSKQAVALKVFQHILSLKPH
ncbi:MAG: phosphopantothenoylcysteine decarboxylase, partial [Cyclonatronaceae bacterium]